MKKFIWNEHGVCTNPYSEIIHECSSFLVKILTACHKGRWYFGYDTDYKGSSVGCGFSCASPNNGKNLKTVKDFDSRQQAREAAAKYIIQYQFKENYNRPGGNHPNGTSNEKVIQALRNVFTPQLEMFHQ